MDRQFGVVYENVPKRADDLTQIAGIRTREAVLLNQRGVYLFGQIALWRHREIVAIAAELQVSVSRIIDEAWIDQARTLSHSPEAAVTSSLPASALRTVTLLACALLIGFFTIYVLGQRRNQALTGVLSADITSICVPAPSRLTAVHVKPGQEVFSGQPLLTLEKLEHLAVLDSQEQNLRKLSMELKRAEAQAKIELEWRTGDVDRNLWDIGLQIAERQNGVQRSQQLARHSRSSQRPNVAVVSSRQMLTHASRSAEAGGLLFFSGSGKFSPERTRPALQSVPVRVAEVPRDGVISDSPTSVYETEGTVDSQLMSLQSEEKRLSSVRASLPVTVSEAMGVTALKEQLDEASQRLETMKSISREVHVNAPVYGVVGQVRYRQGDDLPNGEVMLRILHTDRRYIIVHLPTRRVHEMQTGHEVLLVFPGREEFCGQVVDVPMLVESAEHSGDTMAAVRIEPIGRLWPMVPVGSQVDVISLK